MDEEAVSNNMKDKNSPFGYCVGYEVLLWFMLCLVGENVMEWIKWMNSHTYYSSYSFHSLHFQSSQPNTTLVRWYENDKERLILNLVSNFEALRTTLSNYSNPKEYSPCRKYTNEIFEYIFSKSYRCTIDLKYKTP